MKRFVLFIAACAPSAPETPSFQQHVAPILAANCIRCHGVPALGGAPSAFRLDTYGGAQRMAEESAARVAAGEMPPRFLLDDYQVDTLANWAAAGAPRGAPRVGNRRPTAVVSAFESGIIDVVVDDLDGDVVGGTLRAGGVAIGLVHSGPNRIETPPGTYDLSATLDDGAAEVIVPLGAIEVTP